jgi:hypothetical protein
MLQSILKNKIINHLLLSSGKPEILLTDTFIFSKKNEKGSRMKGTRPVTSMGQQSLAEHCRFLAVKLSETVVHSNSPRTPLATLKGENHPPGSG